FNSGPLDMAFSSDWALLATAALGDLVSIIDVSSGGTRAVLRDYAPVVVDIGATFDSTVLIAADDGGGLLLWDSLDGSMRGARSGSQDGLYAMDTAPFAPVVATGDGAGRIRLWDAYTGQPIDRLGEHA